MSKTRDRLIAEATRLFAERGYDGTSVRAITHAAEANLNAVSYHFGGKSGLYVAVIQGAGDERLESAKRILGTPARTLPELETRLLVFAEETLASWLASPGLLHILFAEMQQGFRNCGPQAVASLGEHRDVLLAYLEDAQSTGLLRDTLDPAIAAGALLERLNSQVLYADTIEAQEGISIADDAYRRHWARQTIDLLLYGAAVPRPG